MVVAASSVLDVMALVKNQGPESEIKAALYAKAVRLAWQGVCCLLLGQRPSSFTCASNDVLTGVAQSVSDSHRDDEHIISTTDQMQVIGHELSINASIR